MHLQSPPLTMGWTVLKESDHLSIRSDIWFQDDLWEASSLGFQSSFLKTWHLEEVLACVPWYRSLLGRCFLGFVLLVLDYCSAMWSSAADTHLKLLDRAVSCARVLTGGVFECDIAHRRSVAVLCMLYKIRCNPMHPLNGALPGPCLPVRVTRGALVAHRYNYAPPRCRTSQYCMTFILLPVTLWNDLADPVFDGVGLAGFKSRANSVWLS